MQSFPVALFVTALVISVLVTVYTLFDHSYHKKGVKPDASVISVTRRPFNRLKMKTTVLFDDGFKFVSFRTESMPSGIGSAFGYTGDRRDAILELAIARHDELVEKKKYQ